MADAAAQVRVPVTKPPAGEHVFLSVESGRIYALDFEPGDCVFNSGGDDIEIGFEDGALLTLQGFISAASGGSLTLELTDGTQILGLDVVEALLMPLDMDTGVFLAANEAALAAPQPHGGLEEFSALLEPPGSEIAPVCSSFCDLPEERAEPLSGAPWSVCPPSLGGVPPGHALPGLLPAQDKSGLPDPAGAGTPFRVPAGDVLALHDLLDIPERELFFESLPAFRFMSLLPPGGCAADATVLAASSGYAGVQADTAILEADSDAALWTFWGMGLL